jgi:hypothetical protein
MRIPNTARRLILSSLLALPFAAPAADITYGSHGMVLFGGKDGLYASHLPMFHPPHDTQVVLRLHFADPGLDASMRARLEGRTALWTLDPDKFELSRLAPGAAQPLRTFAANVVEGHFEQGGATRYGHAPVIVDEVLVYRPLSPAGGVRARSTYVPVGTFLVKLIDSRPDVDHIVRLRRPPGAPVVIDKPGLIDDTALLSRVAPVAGTVWFGTDDLR